MEEKNDGSPWFWKVFGTSIIGSIVILLSFILTSLNSNIGSYKNELNDSISQFKTWVSAEISKLRDDLSAIKAKSAGYDEFREAIKEKTASLESGIQERAKYSEANVAAVRDKDKEHDAHILELRERVLKLEEKISKLELALQKEAK